MKVQVLDERGFDIAIFGLGFSRGITNEMEFSDFESVNVDDNTNTPEYNQMFEVAHRLASKDNGENKFLESIAVWLDIDAPRYWWMQFDTYRVGVTKQSESTMYGIMRRFIKQDDFEGFIPDEYIEWMNIRIDNDLFWAVTDMLPQSYLQRRIVATNYKALRHIYQQRHNHKLEQWHIFCNALLEQLQHPEFLK